MRIWILTQYYPPEVGAAAIRLSRLAQLFAADGHEVVVLTSVPNYPSGIILPPYRGRLTCTEKDGAVTIRRVWVYAIPSRRNRARLLNQISFMAASALCGTFLPRPDVLLVESHPLFVCLSAGWLHLVKQTPIVLNVSDLWPESAVATGALRADSLYVKVAERVERWAYRTASQIVGMTEGVIAGVNKVLGQPQKVTMIQNAVDLTKFRPGLTTERSAMRERLGLNGKLVAVHVGNMSLTYDFDMLLDAAAQLPHILFLFVGDGSQRKHIEELISTHGLTNMKLIGTLPHQDMPAIWASADLCLIALRDHSVAGGTRPAKMFEAMASGVPIVAAIRGEGETLLRESGAGIPTAIGEPRAMIETIETLANSAVTRQEMSAAGRCYAEAHLHPARVKDAYLHLFEQAVEQRTRKQA